jgi:hypothetical protein
MNDLEQLAKNAIAGATVFPIETGCKDPSMIELTGSQIDMERERRTRRAQLAESTRGGRSDPWAVSHILSVDFWELLEPSIASGIVWLSAQRSYGYRFQRGGRSFTVLRSDYYGFNPLTKQLRDSLREVSPDFRRHESDGTLREVERPRVGA